MKKLLLLSVAMAVLPMLPAWAQDEASEADNQIVLLDEKRTDLVVVASGIEQPPEQSGRVVTLLDRETIERRQTVSVADLLATTPGVSVTRNGGPGGVTAVRIRGAEDAQTLMLIDGVRVNDPSAPAGAFDFGNLLAGSVERVEVLRGPSSVLWGSQAIGGVVNVVTEAPIGGLRARANAEYGTADQINANAALIGGSDTVQGAVTAGYFRTDGISTAASGTEPDGYRQFGASGRLNVEFAPGFGAELRGYFADSKLDLDGFPPPTYEFADTAEYSTAQEIYGYAGLYGTIGPVRNRVAFTLADINRDNFDPAIGADPAFLYRGRSERYLYRGDADLDIVTLAFGAEHEDSGFFDGADRFTAGITSVYGQASVTPIDAVTLTAGIRNDDHSRFGSHVVWGADAVVRLSDTILRAAYGEGFKAPTLYQLFAPFYGTSTLAPETAESWEAGIEQKLVDGALTARATWFHRDTSNQIDFDLVSFTYANIARTRAEGLEFELELRPSAALTVSANYTLTDSENRSAGYEGNVLARRPRDVASMSADWETPLGLTLGGTVTIVGDSFNDPGNFTRLDGYALASIRAEMPIGDRFAVYGRIENLTDAKYETVAGYGTFGRAAYAGVRVKLD